MASVDPPQDLLAIRCASCGTRFEVKEEMRGRMVECGECDHQFVIQDSVIVRGRKFFPGEKRDPLLDQVAKVSKPLPNASDEGAPDSFASQSSPVYTEPVSPQRILMVLLASFAVLITALFLTLGASRGGALDGVSLQNRMVMASFVALLATGLLIYSNTRAWLLMLMFGLVIGGGLVSLPLIFKGGATYLGEDDVRRSTGSITGTYQSPGADYTLDELRELVGTEPLDKERKRLLEDGSERTALGLWLTNLDESNRLLIKEYMIREMRADEESHFYPRGSGDFLMVVTGIDDDLDRLALAAEPLGRVKAIHKTIHTVEVEVDNSNFKSGPIEKLTDPKNPEFYRLNAIELKSIDLDRVAAAVRRVAEAQPVLLREDIDKRLLDLLGSEWFEDKAGVSRALLVWTKEDSDAGRVALEQAVILQQEKKQVPEEIIALCLKQHEFDILPLLYELWLQNPSRWEPWFREAGEAAEKVVLLGFDNTTGMMRQSACRILGQIGGQRSVPILRVTASTTSDPETRIIAETSVELIEKRLRPADESR